MFPAGSLNSWSSFQSKVKYSPRMTVSTQSFGKFERKPRDDLSEINLTCWWTVLLKMWPPDTYLKPAFSFGKWWRSDNADHEHGFNIGEVRTCMRVSVEQAGRKAFQGSVLGESVTVSRRIKALRAARTTFFLFHTRKLLFSRAARRL